MFSNLSDVEKALEQSGEMHVVLDSDREYALHPGDTEFVDGLVVTEGIDGGEEVEYVTARFPPEAVEHYYTHREM